MTTVVSRLYDSVETANSVADQLRAVGFPDATISIITNADAGEIAAARVSDAAAESYAAAMTGGQALFVCRAPFTPFGAARTAIATADGAAWIDTGMGARNEHVTETPDLEKHLPAKSTKHDLVMTPADYVGSGISEWQLSRVFGWPTISKGRVAGRPTVLSGTRYMSRSFWPGKLLSNKPRKTSVMDGETLMSKRFGNFPVLTERKEKLSVMTDHPLISQRFGMKMLSERR
jgi:hypothetical protein